jgi:hypothetical protein
MLTREEPKDQREERTLGQKRNKRIMILHKKNA